MEIQNILNELASIQGSFISYIDDEENIEENFQNFISLIDETGVCRDKNKFKTLFHLILIISNKHHRFNNFFIKIEKIFQYYKDKIHEIFSNNEIFNLVKTNKRILLFFIEEKMLIVNKSISSKILDSKLVKLNYQYYFLPEIKPFIRWNLYENYKISLNSLLKDDESSQNSETSENSDEFPSYFYENRKIGENHEFICKIIREDLIKEFIKYSIKTDLDLNSCIKRSIYETNEFLLKKENITLIEYAAFCGSIQIFKYLFQNGVKLTRSLWDYAVHGINIEIINILEINNIKPEDKTYKQVINLTISCHHNDLTNYIQSNFIQNYDKSEDDNKNDNKSNGNEKNKYHEAIFYLENYNFALLQEDMINDSLFHYLIKYDYYSIACILLKSMNIDINKTIIIIIVNFMTFHI